MGTKGKRKLEEGKLIRVINSPRLRMIESKTVSKSYAKKARERLSGGVAKPPMFNPLAGP